MRIDRPKNSIRRIALTPMIDVVFLLLAFFMLASTFSKVQTRPFALGDGGKGAAEQSAPPLAIVLKTAGAITLDGIEIDPDALERGVRRARAARPDRGVTIEPEAGVTVQVLVNFLDRVEAMDVGAVQLVRRLTEDGAGGAN